MDPISVVKPSGRRIQGFHGTSFEAARSIVKSQEFRRSTNRGDWLGHGTYFWEDNWDRAVEWALEHHPTNPAVVSAEVDLGRCIDLFDSQWFRLIKVAHQDVLGSCRAAGSSPLENKGKLRPLDCAVIERLCQLRPTAQTVRGPFYEGDLAYPESAFLNLTHIQVCVRELSNIRPPITQIYPRPST